VQGSISFGSLAEVAVMGDRRFWSSAADLGRPWLP